MIPRFSTSLAYLSILFLSSSHTNYFVKGQDPEQQQTVPPFNPGDEDFLFVGNSYTKQNDLYKIFDGVVKDGFPEFANQIGTQAASLGGKTFQFWVSECNLNEGGTRPGKFLRSALVEDPIPWQWVTLQEQSQTPGTINSNSPSSPFPTSLANAKILNDLVAATGADTMFYMTWGRFNGDRNNPELNPDFLTMQQNIQDGYFKYVEETSTPSRPTYVSPVGLAYKTIYEDLVAQNIVPTDDGTFFQSLYTRDGSHPTPRGSYTAALTIYASMFGKDPKLINWWPTNIEEPVDEATARILQDAVSRTVLSTFESGLIQYPWTTSWTGSTAPGQQGGGTPTTTAPTAAPSVIEQTSAMVPDGDGDGDGDGDTTTDGTSESRSAGSITIEIQYDDYPQDIAWSLLVKKEDFGHEVLYFQPLNSMFTQQANQVETFSNLTLNEVYTFKIYDHQGDGICCSFGEGYVKITDNTNVERSGTILYDLGEALGSYYELDMEVNDVGQSLVTVETDEYAAGSWQDLETILYVVDESIEPEWPGKEPTEVGSIVINIDLDNNPQDITWELYQDETNTLIQSWDGSTATAGSLNSTEVLNLQEGWYRFVATDSAQNGLICTTCDMADPLNGYITILGFLAVFQDWGLIWGNDGDFGEQAAVKFLMDDTGYVAQVEFQPSELERTPAPIRNGTSTEAPSKTTPPAEGSDTEAPTIDSDELTVTLQPVSTQPPGDANGTMTSPPDSNGTETSSPETNGTETTPAPGEPTATTAPTNASAPSPAPSSSSLPSPKLSYLASVFLVGMGTLFSCLP